ncbi:hypothetical protein [Paenibacillus pseudetheri]|uniref:hypothetical protein n=1 Tax=Paenibacillus pseudetheri TaxID=2897682 RepID=UPI001F15AD51|nr:hypothetical protein [Paenibacillus pseudetheri]
MAIWITEIHGYGWHPAKYIQLPLIIIEEVGGFNPLGLQYSPNGLRVAPEHVHRNEQIVQG